MKLVMDGNNLKVIKEDNDPCFSGVKNAAGESRLLYHVKNQLNADPTAIGLPANARFIKKRMHKDGHLVDDMQQYIRLSKPVKDKGMLSFRNTSWAIRGAEEDFRDGKTFLTGEWI